MSISFAGGQERTVFPAKVFDNYVYTFTRGDESGGEPLELSPDGDGLFTLEVGGWRVDVEAYVGEIDPDNRAATGTGNFTVSSGPTTEVTVTLDAVVTDGYGTFTYTVQYPAIAEAEITLQKLPGLTAVDLTPDSEETVDDSIVITKTAENVPAGYYLLTLQISNGGWHTGTSEVVHIYPLLAAAYEAAFDEADLLPTVVSIAAIRGITPVAGEAPATAITETEQYTGTVSWNPDDAAFAVAATYTATVTLALKNGYTLQSIPANFFTVATASSVSNAAGSGEITAVFTTPHSHIRVTNTTGWNDALSTIRNGGVDKNYIIEVAGDVGIGGTTSGTFGTVTGITVTLTGDGRLFLNGNGSIIRVGANQTLVIDSADLTLEGRSGNNTSAVYAGGTNARLELKSGTVSGNTAHSSVSGGYNGTSSFGGGVYVDSGGSFTMSGGVISGNTASVFTNYVNGGSFSGGGGVCVGSGGSNFTMNGGTISGNTTSVSGNSSYSSSSYGSSGGGVYVGSGSSFTMNGGVISGNTAAISISGAGSASSSGGGVSNGGTFRITGGVVYGSNEGALSNTNTTRNNGAALYNGGTAQRGIFDGETWNSINSLSTTDNTMRVIDGLLEGVGEIGNITAQIWHEGNAVSLTAPSVNLLAGQTVTAQGWQISDTGSGDWTNFTLSVADMSYNGKYLRYYATSGGQTYYSNTVTILVISVTGRQVTVDMYDLGGNGWESSAYGNGALRININGVDIATNVKVQNDAAQNTPSGQRSFNTYTFGVEAGDVVQLYWVSGGSPQENSFIVYYTDTPPSPAFTNTSWDGSNALVYRLRNTIPIVFNSILLGSFTVWSPNAQYTVTFNADGGEPAPEQQTVTHGNKISEPAAMTKTGYTFDAWYKEEARVNVWNFAVDIVIADTILYARWVTDCTVTFNSNGGSDVDSQTVTYGSKAVKPTDPTKTGTILDTFKGWYDENLTTAFDFDTPITTDITLYAKWDFPYDLGGIGPGGGKVFYRSETGFTMTDNNEVCHYLEAAPNDAGNLVWVPAIPGGADTWITGTNSAIGAGRKNTALILAWYSDAPAAKACNDYSNNGKTDWFLPSSNELMQLYNNRTYADNLEDSYLNLYYYWSSDTTFEFTNDTLYHIVTCIGFRSGDASYRRGNNQCYVRPIRAF